MSYVLHQFAKTLPNDPVSKKSFIQSGGLKKIQEIKTSPGNKLKQYIDEINALYPLEIVQYYSHGYGQTLMQKLEEK